MRKQCSNQNKIHKTDDDKTDDDKTDNKFTAVIDQGVLWSLLYPYNKNFDPIVLDVQFLTGTTPDNSETSTWLAWEKAWVAKIITESIMIYANITFIFHINDDSKPIGKPDFEIKISRLLNQGCFSSLGCVLYNANNGYGYLSATDIGETMNLGWMDAPYDTTFTYNGKQYKTGAFFENGGYVDGLGSTIVHEFGHALGMLHELQAPSEFKNPLVFNTSNTELFYKLRGGTAADANNQVIRRESGSNYNGTSFDINSIMKYSLPACLLQKGNGYENNNDGSDPCYAFSKAKKQTDFYYLGNQTIGTYIHADTILQPGLDIQNYTLVLSECDKTWLINNYPGKTIVGPIPQCTLQSFNNPNSLPYPTNSTSFFTLSNIFIFIVFLIILISIILYVIYR